MAAYRQSDTWICDLNFFSDRRLFHLITVGDGGISRRNWFRNPSVYGVNAKMHTLVAFGIGVVC